jgi:hypothetical protein
MELIIKQDSFDLNRIKFKYGLKCIKLIYDLYVIKMIGITLKLSSRNLNETPDFLFINLNGSDEYELLKKIDAYFANHFNHYSSFIIHDIIKVKKHDGFKSGEIYITLNNLKKINDVFKVQIFTI